VALNTTKEESLVQVATIEEILDWLDPHPDNAAAIYLQLRHDLAKIFAWNHCADAEGLVDEVTDRVARKFYEYKSSFVGDPRLYFYGIARNIIKETLKQSKYHVSLDDVDLPTMPPPELLDETAALREDCLHQCLQELSEERRDLILAYYAHEQGKRIPAREDLAHSLGISVETLRVRAYRIRGMLETCLRRRLGKRNR
jgi:RNA polymerase sigma factor (sigma-70 family)